ncbi:MAG TPA: TIM barrel protein [Microlunatus sp.]|nr:TIM barrel protein [Microlunatus sp.]
MVKAVHSWSLFRTMGRYVAPGSMPSGDLPEGGGGGLSLLELPAELSGHGYRSVQLCHFYLPHTDPGYLDEVRAALDAAGVELECFLVDDGDLTASAGADEQEAWLSGWLDVAEQLRAPRVRIPAGKQAPTPERLAESAARLRRLAAGHRSVRVVTENWHALLPDAAAVTTVLDAGEGEVGFLIDLGNWRGPDKYEQLARVAARAETCQAKCRIAENGELDLEDYRASLGVLRDAGYSGPLAMVYDGPDPDEWGHLEQAYAVVREVFPNA